MKVTKLFPEIKALPEFQVSDIIIIIYWLELDWENEKQICKE